MPTSRRGRPCADCGQPIDHDKPTVSYCQECWKRRRREAQARYRQNNREKINAYNAGWLKAHPDVNRQNVARSRRRKSEEAPSGGE